jgi:hypothetical protein
MQGFLRGLMIMTTGIVRLCHTCRLGTPAMSHPFLLRCHFMATVTPILVVDRNLTSTFLRRRRHGNDHHSCHWIIAIDVAVAGTGFVLAQCCHRRHCVVADATTGVIAFALLVFYLILLLAPAATGSVPWIRVIEAMR